MITRNTARHIEDLFATGGSGLSRLENVMKGTLLLLQGLISSLPVPTSLWAAGAGAKIAAADPAGRPEGSQYTTRWWLLMQAGLGVLTVAFAAPLATLLSLAVVDAKGAVVLGEDGQPIRPFAVFDPASLPAEWLGWNLRTLVYGDPETDAPVVEASEEVPSGAPAE